VTRPSPAPDPPEPAIDLDQLRTWYPDWEFGSDWEGASISCLVYWARRDGSQLTGFTAAALAEQIEELAR
jgi:hypothetical protein